MQNPRVSALVLNYRSPKDTVRCVRSLLSQTLADQLEVLVIDNHSRNDSIGVLRNTFSSSRVRIIETSRNTGYGSGNNFGARFATGEFLLIINPDNELEPDGLETMVRLMESDPMIGMLAPRLIHQDGSLRASFRRFPTMTDVFIKRTLLRHVFPERVEQYLHANDERTGMRDVDWVVGACFLVRRDLFEQLGGFDERFFLFFEDTDLCRRVWQAGKRVVYCPQVSATDRKTRLSEGGILSVFIKWTVREHLRSGVKYFWKWRGKVG